MECRRYNQQIEKLVYQRRKQLKISTNKCNIYCTNNSICYYIGNITKGTYELFFFFAKRFTF